MPARILTIITLIIFSLSLAIHPVKADNLHITASVAAKPTDFQLQVSSHPTGPLVGPGQIITYTATYGSHLAQAIDGIVIVVSWQQNPDSPDLIDYIPNSAKPAIGGAQPIVDLRNKTITWNINPMPPGLNRHLSWQLIIDQHRQAKQHFNITTNVRLIAPGVQLIANPLELTLSPGAPLQPTPTIPQPTTPVGHISPTPTTSPTGQPTPTSPTPTTPSILQPNIDGTIISARITLLLTLLALVTLGLFIRWMRRHHMIDRLLLLVTKQAHLYGYIYHQHNPKSHQPIIIHDQQTNNIIKRTRTNKKGYFHVHLSPGHYALTTDIQGQDTHLGSIRITPADYGHFIERSYSLIVKPQISKNRQPADKS